MAYRIEIDAAARRGVGLLSASVTGGEFAGAMRTLYFDARWRPGYTAVWDFTAVRSLVVDQRDIEAIVAAALACEPRMGEGHGAIVVPDETHRTIAALLVHRTKPDTHRERRLFTTRAAADAWLDAATGG